MSGVLVGEVVRAAPRLYAAGLSRNAVQALVPIAEECREASRQGSCTHAVIAAWIDRSVRTAERSVAELVDAGVLVVTRRGGGVGKAVNRYYLVPLESWTRQASPAIQVAADQGRQSPLVASVTDDVSRHSDGGSSTGAQTSSPATQMAGDDRDGHPEMAGVTPNSRQNGPELPPSMGVGSSGVSGKEPGEAAPDVATDLPRFPDTAPPPTTSSTTSTAPAGSRCGRVDCRTPRPCGACADARRAEAAAAERFNAEFRRSVSDGVFAAAAARAAAIANCVLGCDARGYLGRVVCDHDPDRIQRARRGRALVDAALRRPRSRADIERAQQDALTELDAVQAAPDGTSTSPAHPPQPADQRSDVA